MFNKPKFYKLNSISPEIYGELLNEEPYLLPRNPKADLTEESIRNSQNSLNDEICSVTPTTLSPISLKPNRNPPSFDSSQPPIILRSCKPSFGLLAWSLPNASKSSNTRLIVTPAQEISSECLVIDTAPDDPSHSATILLHKQILHPGGLEIHLSPADLLSSVAFVDVGDRVWVSGWKVSCTRLHNLFHIGDQIVLLDDFPIFSKDLLIKALKSTCSIRDPQTMFNYCDSSDPAKYRTRIRIRRIPYGKAMVACKQHSTDSLGLVFKEGTNEIFEIDPDGVAAKCGLSSIAPSFMNKPSSFSLKRHRLKDSEPVVSWTLTEVNNRPLNMFNKNNEALMLINIRCMEISLVFHPTDFVDALKKQLKHLFSYKKYCP